MVIKSPDQSPSQSKWKTLHERGVRLADEDIDFVTGHVDKGIDMVKKSLNLITDSAWPTVIFDDQQEKIGWAISTEYPEGALNIPIKFSLLY